MARSLFFIVTVVTLAFAGTAMLAQGQEHGVGGQASLPDLVRQRINIELETGGSCDFASTSLGVRIVIENQGQGDAGPFSVGVNDAEMRVSAGLPAGQKTSLWFPGYNVGENDFDIDIFDEVDESNESNNAEGFKLPVPTLPATCTPAPTTPTPIPPAGLIGDVDCSGSVTAIDAAFLLQFIASLTDSLPCENLADSTDNGVIDAVDVTLILQFSAGLLNEL